MARKTSKKTSKKAQKRRFLDTQRSATPSANKAVRPSLWSRVKRFRTSPHRTFHRSYREDYKRELEVPGMMAHIFKTFQMIFKNWKVFLPLLILSVLMAVTFVGIMNENTYQQFQEILDQTTAEMGGGDIGMVAKASLLLISTVTTGGLSGSSSEAAAVFAVLIFLMIWLTTIFLLRHIMAKQKVKFRDALYNSMSPLVPSLAIFVVAIFQCIPIFIFVIVLSAAIQTEFLAAPFYALIFFIFSALMFLLSGYLLSSSLMAFVAVSAPGLYPIKALRTASELMQGRRIRFMLRLVSLILTLVVMWVLVMLPLIVFDLFMKQFEWTSQIPFVPICLLIMTCFTGIYITAYLYIYYRWMLDA